MNPESTSATLNINSDLLLTLTNLPQSNLPPHIFVNSFRTILNAQCYVYHFSMLGWFRLVDLMNLFTIQCTRVMAILPFVYHTAER